MELISEPSHQMVWKPKHHIPIDGVRPLRDINFSAVPNYTCMWADAGGPRQEWARPQEHLQPCPCRSPADLSFSSTHDPSSHSQDLSECLRHTDSEPPQRHAECLDDRPLPQHDDTDVPNTWLLLCDTEGYEGTGEKGTFQGNTFLIKYQVFS